MSYEIWHADFIDNAEMTGRLWSGRTVEVREVMPREMLLKVLHDGVYLPGARRPGVENGLCVVKE